MLSYDAALALVLGEAGPLGEERVPLSQALGRRLARAIVATADSPAADVSAMDGYAVREAELGAGSLRVVGESFPGRGFAGAVPASACVRIFTGGAVPVGLDRIVVQEIVARDGDVIRLTEAPGGARFIRPRGLDFRAGETLVPAGRIVDPRVIVAAAGADLGELVAHRCPRVLVLATGDELFEPGDPARHAAGIPDSASHGVAALAQALGARAERHMARDDLEAIAALGRRLADISDLIVVTGGASVGDRDFAKPAFERIGLNLIFSKVAMRPGKPVWFGRVGDALVLGLPGNPTSAMVTARLFLQPLLTGWGGGGEEAWRRLPLAGALGPCDARETFVRARSTGEGAMPLGNQDSSAQKTLADADLLIRRRPGAAAAAAGEAVEVIDF